MDHLGSPVMDHPISLSVTDDLSRNRWTVGFRWLLVIPHLIWLTLWGIAVSFAVIASWFATLFAGTTPQGLHDFIAQYLRYSTHVNGYLYFLADPYPGFLGDRPYGADLSIAPPAPQNRWITGFRLIVAIPALIVAYVIGILLAFMWLVAWVVGIVMGAIPLGMRNLIAWCVRFIQQTNGYLMLLTDRYPDFSTDPSA
jgi:Domain of unknown function (DUF4389)